MLRSLSSTASQENAGRVAVAHVHHRVVGLDGVEVADEAQHAGVAIPFGQAPVEPTVVAPLLRVGELAAHEQELLAGVRPHPRVEGAQVGEALVVVAARHLAEQRPLEVHHLVVAERQHEVLGPRVGEPEGELVVVPAPVVRDRWTSSRACRASTPCSTCG